MELVSSIVRAIRNVRAEFHIDPGKRLEARIAGPGISSIIEDERKAIEKLASVGLAQDTLAQGSAVTLVVGDATVSLQLSDQVDLDAERRRLQGELREAEEHGHRLRQRLADQQFTAKAPEEVVEQERQRLTALEERRNIIQRAAPSAWAVIRPPKDSARKHEPLSTMPLSWINRDGKLIIMARACRLFAQGPVVVLLIIYLDLQGISIVQSGLNHLRRSSGRCLLLYPHGPLRELYRSETADDLFHRRPGDNGALSGHHNQLSYPGSHHLSHRLHRHRRGWGRPAAVGTGNPSG